MSNPITSLTKKEWGIWMGALLVIVVSNIFSANFNALTSGFMRRCDIPDYCGERECVVTYSDDPVQYPLRTSPGMAVWSTITWIRNPSESGKEVEIQQLTKKHVFLLVSSTTVITILFFKILAVLETPNIVFSTISITTSFLAASLTMLRSSYYAVGYVANDIVLIVLWIMATIKDPSYFSVMIIFTIFFFFDLYGFISWKKEKQRCRKRK